MDAIFRTDEIGFGNILFKYDKIEGNGEALGLKERRRKEAADGSYIIVEIVPTRN
ncbi:hypothetical protein [Fusobacterium necrophorum]|uniref:hypothetical protein n=1 Tax=Fusobacterium necrophorum TaxID=859 RepID=UPI0021C41A26|nr:hypothetical protein [Fusobacterium necrophorum]